MKIPKELCIKCKGARRLCGLSYCPLVSGFISRVEAIQSINGLDVEGSTPPSLIVGEKGYPRIKIYYGIPPGIRGDRARIYDDPRSWFKRFSLEDIVRYRSKLLHIVLPVKVNDPYKLYENEVGLAVLSVKPVDTEAQLLKKPIPRLSFDSLTPPRGPSAPAKKILVTSNPVVSRSLEKIIWDDLRAEEAIIELYRSNIDFYTIVRALSIGFLGRIKQRRIVPTRWSITAVDSTISKKLLKHIRMFKSIDKIRVFYSEYLYNKYLVVLAPGGYRGMWIEVWQPHSLWNPHSTPSVLIVRDSYRGEPDIMDGGYLAARTSVLEYLYRIKRQARVLILREVMPQYMFPVGNWQIRLSIAHALEKGELLVDPSTEELVNVVKEKFYRIPKNILTKVIEYVYGLREIQLDKWL